MEQRFPNDVVIADHTAPELVEVVKTFANADHGFRLEDGLEKSLADFVVAKYGGSSGEELGERGNARFAKEILLGNAIRRLTTRVYQASAAAVAEDQQQRGASDSASAAAVRRCRLTSG